MAELAFDAPVFSGNLGGRSPFRLEEAVAPTNGYGAKMRPQRP